MEGTQNKAEKKVRKAMEKLNMKPVENVETVAMKKMPGSQMIVIPRPQVYKSGGGGSETYFVFGKIGSDQPVAEPAPSAPLTSNNGIIPDEDDEGPPALTPAAPASTGAPVSASGHSEKDIQLVMSQASVDREKAIAALLRNEGDIVNSIMDL
jgi:nascent polypeptide-associated complex subunit alpha